jgi:hypothetical protein
MAALAAPAQAITHTGPANPFQLQANTRYCIGSSNTYAVLVKCSRSNAQKWYPSKNYLPDDTNPMFQQKSSILCLTADYYTANSWVTIDSCHDQTSRFDGKQTFRTVGYYPAANWTSVNAWTYHKSHVCLGVTSVASGQHIKMVKCNYKDKKQRWNKG